MASRSTSSVRGFTLVELLITSAIFAVIYLFVSSYVVRQMGAQSALDAEFLMKETALSAFEDMRSRLSQAERLFFRTSPYHTFSLLSRMEMTGAPSWLAGSQLTEPMATGGDSTYNWWYFRSNFGNMLHFLENVKPVDLQTSSGPLRVDRYRFNMYYLSPVEGSFLGKGRRHLWRWTSKVYAYRSDLERITDAALRTEVIGKLMALGLTHAIDTSQINASGAFFALGAGGAMTADPGHVIPRAESVCLTKAVSRSVLGGELTVLPNTDGLTGLRHTVPLWSDMISGEFPSGFETLVLDHTDQREIFVRLTLGVAAGGGKTPTFSMEQIFRVDETW